MMRVQAAYCMGPGPGLDRVGLSSHIERTMIQDKSVMRILNRHKYEMRAHWPTGAYDSKGWRVLKPLRRLPKGGLEQVAICMLPKFVIWVRSGL